MKEKPVMPELDVCVRVVKGGPTYIFDIQVDPSMSPGDPLRIEPSLPTPGHPCIWWVYKSQDDIVYEYHDPNWNEQGCPTPQVENISGPCV